MDQDDYQLAAAVGLTLEQLHQARQAERLLFESAQAEPELLPNYDLPSQSGGAAVAEFAAAWALLGQPLALDIGAAPAAVEADAQRVNYDAAWLTGFRSITQLLSDISPETHEAYLKMVASEAGWSPLSPAETRETTQLLFGPQQSMETRRLARWLRHPLLFYQDEVAPWQLLQLIGGPCGVVAVVQAHLLSALFYDPQAGPGTVVDRAAKPAHNVQALRLVVAEVLTRVIAQAAGPTKQAVLAWLEPPPADYISGLVSELNLRSGQQVSGVKSELHAALRIHQRAFASTQELGQYIHDNLLTLFCGPRVPGCLNLVLSCILSRSVKTITAEDADPECLAESSALIAEHGHCSQEMMNLLLTGRAVSNTFDGERRVDELILKGIETRPVCGYLTEMEVLRYTSVGDHLKAPLTPVWVVGKANHFTAVADLAPAQYKLSKRDWLSETAEMAWKTVDKESQGILDVQKFSTELATALGLEPGSAQLRACVQQCRQDNVVLLHTFSNWLLVNHQLCPAVQRALDANPVVRFRLRHSDAPAPTPATPSYLYLDGQLLNLSEAVDQKQAPRATARWLLQHTSADEDVALSEIMNTRRGPPLRLLRTEFFARP